MDDKDIGLGIRILAIKSSRRQFLKGVAGMALGGLLRMFDGRDAEVQALAGPGLDRARSEVIRQVVMPAVAPGLQNLNIAMIGQGILGDTPPNTLQPRLPDGIHLRWSFRRELGFPWYGFFLFRRPHHAGQLLCLSSSLQGIAPGNWAANELTTTRGTISSDRPLVLTDDFPTSGIVEFDLLNREWLRFTLPTGQLARRVEVQIGFRQASAPSTSQPPAPPIRLIEVTALRDGIPLGTVLVKGLPGQVVKAALQFDAISDIELTSGAAALVDLCYVPVAQDATADWAPVHGFDYPFSLPLTHPDYPCSTGPVDAGRAETRALGRIRYGPPGDWHADFADLHTQLINLVVGGPGSTPMADRTLPPLVGAPIPPDPGDALDPPIVPGHPPLDLVLLGTLHPAFTQMVGLYWVDQTAPAGVAYDYLLVADYLGQAPRDPAGVLALLQQEGFLRLEGYIVFNQVMAPADPLSAPDGVRAYALPGTTVRAPDGTVQDATNNAGLRWNLPPDGLRLPDQAIMYHVWRAGRGNNPLPDPPGPYTLITVERTVPRPVLLGTSVLPPGAAPQWPDNAPPFALYYTNRALLDGWYGYQVSGIDIWGRHSPNSRAAAWYVGRMPAWPRWRVQECFLRT